jgi:hypothetical protein
MWPLLTNPKAQSPHKLFCYYLDNQLQVVRSGRWKLFLEHHTYPALTTIMCTNRPQVMQKHFPRYGTSSASTTWSPTRAKSTTWRTSIRTRLSA